MGNNIYPTRQEALEAKSSGVDHTCLYVGKPCKHCGNTLRYSLGHCVDCQSKRNSSDEKKEYNKQWREDNPDYDKQWREDNPDYDKKSIDKKHYQNNKEMYYARVAKRRAALKGNESPSFFPPDCKRHIKAIYAECDRLNGIHGPNSYNVDHLYPVSKGGCSNPINLCITTREENRSKRDRLPTLDEMMQSPLPLWMLTYYHCMQDS